MKPDRQKVHAKYGGKCGYCGCEIDYSEMQIDHIIPKHQFRSRIVVDAEYVPCFLRHLTQDDMNHFDNLMPSCRSCNFYKGTNTLEQFAEMIRTIPDRLDKEFIFRLGRKYNKIQSNTVPVIFYFETIGKK